MGAYVMYVIVVVRVIVYTSFPVSSGIGRTVVRIVSVAAVTVAVAVGLAEWSYSEQKGMASVWGRSRRMVPAASTSS